jgi:Zn-dependent peptidase ImmA (M78 family)
MTDEQRRQEAEATYFATCLLMPRDLVLQELAKAQEQMGHKHWEDVIQRLADLFGVSVERMALRVGELTAIT